MERTARAPDGRILAIEEAGDPNGRPVLVHMGTPNSRHLYQPVTIDAAVRGLRLISYDRPGYGGSDPQPGRSVADVRVICAELGIASPRCTPGWPSGYKAVTSSASRLTSAA